MPEREEIYNSLESNAFEEKSNILNIVASLSSNQVAAFRGSITESPNSGASFYKEMQSLDCVIYKIQNIHKAHKIWSKF